MSRRKHQKDWWKGFFGSLAGQIMFDPREAQSKKEVIEVLRHTGTKGRASILDLACGEGRHSIALAKKGFDVVGLDYSRVYLARAQKKAVKNKLVDHLRFQRGDMRLIAECFGNESFDLVVSLYNSFGYFDRRSDDLKVLKGVFKVLKPGGSFVLNTLNKNGVLVRLAKPVSLGREPKRNVFMIDQAEYDPARRRTISCWTIIDIRKPSARVERLRFGQNVYSHAELKGLLTAVRLIS